MPFELLILKVPSFYKVESVSSENTIDFLLNELKLFPIKHFFEHLGYKVYHSFEEVLIPVHHIVGPHFENN